MEEDKKETKVRQLVVEGCGYCHQQNKYNVGIFPAHDPSPNCQSGSKLHCTCPICFS